MSWEIIDHVQAQFDSISTEQIIQMITFDPEIDPVLDEAIGNMGYSAISATPATRSTKQVHQQAQQQIHPPIPAVEN